MKRLLTLALALVALPLAALAQAGGWTVMGHPHPLVVDPNPIIQPWAGYTNEIYTYIDTTGATNESPIVVMSALTNIPDFAPDDLDMKYGTWYGTNGLDFPYGGQAWRISIATHRTNNPGELVWAYTDGSPLPLHITADFPQIYFMNYVATIGGWGGGSNTTFYYNTNCYGCSTAKSGDFIWARGGVTTGSAISTRMAVDHSGNIISVGTFLNSLSFGGIVLTNHGNQDIFIVKYDSSGNVLWAQSIGNVEDEDIWGVAVDSTNNIIITGSFGGASGTNCNFWGTNLTSAGQSDIYVAKYSPGSSGVAGSLLWAESFGGTFSDYGRALAVDTNGNVFLGATYNSTNIVFGTNTFVRGSGQGLVFAKLSGSDGSVLWAKGYSATSLVINDMAVDKSGDVVAVGQVYGSINFGGGAQSGGGGYDIFVVKLAGTSGAWEWSKVMGSTIGDAAYGVATDPTTGNVIITGSYGGAMDFGGPIMDAWGETNTVGGIFLVDYNSSGTFQWAFSPNTTFAHYGADGGHAVTVDSSGNIYYTGQCQAGVWFTSAIFPPGTQYDYFSSSVTSSGVYRWAHRSTNSSGNVGFSIGLDSLGHVITAGQFNGTIYFDGLLGPSGGTLSTPATLTDAFVVQYWK